MTPTQEHADAHLLLKLVHLVRCRHDRKNHADSCVPLRGSRDKLLALYQTLRVQLCFSRQPALQVTMQSSRVSAQRNEATFAQVCAHLFRSLAGVHVAKVGARDTGVVQTPVQLATLRGELRLFIFKARLERVAVVIAHCDAMR